MSPVLTAEDSRAESKAHPLPPNDDWIIQRAIALLEDRLFKAGPVLGSPAEVRDYLRLTLMAEPNEIFAVVFLNTHHRVIACEPLFKGSVDGTAVYPRVVVQRALALNAACVILAHNHPSGVIEPSSADISITGRIKDALATVDIRVLDHFIIGRGTPYSFVEAGLL
ncbi:RadC family protein [Thauera sinica]|uniref:DNA repair protein RadC n=1 Tax=Thauera sinica TaxID=2665146 RepID=A0ABW1AXI0_9RHOO|nr:DNA repair protein RadC [Thauera sp. K11]ATE58729.1 DNA repair protein RadC [Thauera sp. K11]